MSQTTSSATDNTLNKTRPTTDVLYPGCILKWDDRGHWYSGNQVSTYEIVSRLGNQNTSIPKKTREDQVSTIYQTVKSDPEKYGSYAGLNDWSPRFTDAQLEAFVGLVRDTTGGSIQCC